MKILKPSDYILQSSNIPDSSYSAWDSSTSYTTGDKVFFSETYGEYEALKDNTGTKPNEDMLSWRFLQTANKYKMFDQFLNTQSENQNTIEIEIYSYLSNGIFLGNIEANEIVVEVYDNNSVLIESETYNMLRDPLDWEDYFFGEWIDESKTNFFYERKTLANDIIYKIKIDNGTSTKCGICLVGTLSDIGLSLFGVNLSALDYSTITTDNDSGVTYLKQGNYAKSMKLDVSTPTSGLDTVYKKLVELRGKPNVFVGGGNFESLNVFGYIKKFETILSNPTRTKLSLDIAGLI